ncbi:MAG TPA: polysaccharide deacetylase [bacterium]|nr:polysaccharide deacetylase [bacterium]
MTRHLACLTFDFDAVSNWIARGAVTPTAMSRGEFGAVGAGRILDLLKRHGIASTWFIPGHTIETYPEMCTRVHGEGHEIGNHGYLHEPPATLSAKDEEAVLVRGNEALARITGRRARGYRSPAWDLSPHTVSLLLTHGFVYDSSMMAHDCLPYRARQGDDIAPDRPVRWGTATKLVEMPVSWSLDDYPHFEYARTPNGILPGLRRGGDVLDNWVDDFRYMVQTEQWGVLTYTFHPQVTGRGHRMIVLERLIEALAALGATFVRMDAAVEEFVAREAGPPGGSA